MPKIKQYPTGIAVVAAMALLSGCGMMQQQASAPAAAPVAYNPPGRALTELPAGQVTWFHVAFDTGSRTIAVNQREPIQDAAAALRGNSALTATVIGRTDGVGSDSANMRLSEQRAHAVRDALIRQGPTDASRIETRWTGERKPGQPLAGETPDGGARVVDIAIH